jgi:multimeric flavodoxin WrbA
MNKKLILHDLSPADAERFLPPASAECILFPATPPVRYCVGCFGCWIKTPGKCIIPDRGAGLVEPLSLCDEFIVISRMTFGGLSPDVKTVMDRSIGIILPFFRSVNGETHHAKRYDKTPGLKYLFYGTDIRDAEKATAGKLTVANQINLGFGNPSAEFYPTARACAEALNTSGIPSTGTSSASSASDAPQTSESAHAKKTAHAKITLINGSPKPKSSASKLISEHLQEKIGAAADCTICNPAKQGRDEIIESIRGSDALVFIFPLYVDGIPSHLLRLLDEARDEIADAAPGATVYSVVNNGFYEGRQNILALEMMRHFTARAQLTWGRGIGVGAGAMIHSLTIGQGPLKKLGNALSILAKDILSAQNSAPPGDQTVEPNFPRFLYKAAAHSGWRKAARKNGLDPQSLHKK